MRYFLLLLVAVISLSASFAQDEKYELFLMGQKCVPLDDVKSSVSFYQSWYMLAKEYKLDKVPLLNQYDILEFNEETFEIELTWDAFKRLSEIEIPTNGVPVALKKNGKVAYGAWLWTPLSSSICDGVSFTLFKGSDKPVLKVESELDNTVIDRRIPQVE